MINRKQGIVFWIGFFAILACLIYPPYQRYLWISGVQSRVGGVEYRYLFEDQPDPVSPTMYKIDLPRLGTEFGAVAAFCGLAYWISGTKAVSRRRNP